MPISYLEGNPQDVYAIQRAGSTFSDALLGMQQNRMRQQQIANQQALDAAYFQLAQRKAQQEAQIAPFEQSRIGAETNLANARTGDLRMQTDQLAAQMAASKGLGRSMGMLYDPAVDPVSESFLQGDVARYGSELAGMGSPQNIAMQAAQFMQSRDPTMQRLIATKEPAYQAVGRSLYDIPGQREVYSAPSMKSPGELDDARIRALTPYVDHLLELKRRGYDVPELPQIQQQLFQAAGVTNTPAMPQPSQATPQRKLGETVTTAKGTFRWVGNGWEPVSQ